MRWSYNLERSRSVAAWLFLIAAMVVAMVVVGGATRLTGSGLSITEWKPLRGVIPPLNPAQWRAEFDHYKQIPQYRLLNQGMTLGQFQFIYGWEWAHRLLGRLIGAVFFVPLLVFLLLQKIPRRLVWRCWLLFGLGALQGLVGWWMVASGLTKLVYVAPERLATHFGLALVVYMLAVWTGWEAWSGRPRSTEHFAPTVWIGWASGLAALVFLQMILGALVAGNHAGLVYNDWPMMNGRFVPAEYAARGGEGHGLWATLVHSQAAVQFNHRITAYLVLAIVLALSLTVINAKRAPAVLKTWSLGLIGVTLMQVLLGIATLMAGAPLWLSILHQLWAVALLTTALGFVWRLRRC
jgi:heme a synthase